MQFIDDLSQLHHMGKKKEKEKFVSKSLARIYKVFGYHCKRYWKALILAYLSLFAYIGTQVLLPWPLKLILDCLILDKPLPGEVVLLQAIRDTDPKLLLLILALAIVVLAVLKASFSYVNQYWLSSVGARMGADVRERVFAHLQRLSLSFHESVHSGNLAYLLTSDVKEMKGILIDLPQEFVRRLVTFGAYAVVMLALDWRLGLIALSAVPLLYLFTRYFGAGMQSALKKKRVQEGAVASIITENVTSMALIQAYGREETELDRFSGENKGSLEAQMRALRLQNTYVRLTDLLVTLSTAGVLYFGGRAALGGDILPGTLVVFVAYLRDIYGSVEKFGELFLGLAKSRVSAERLLELVENDLVMQDEPHAVPAPPFRGRIEFKNVSFAYKKGQEVLKQLDFVVEPGETVALVGHSGAGKSTLISLLLRFYDPQQGQILIDGEDIRTFTLKSLRNQITIVFQDAKLFRQTVRENIAFGTPGATEEEIIEAAKLAEAHNFIMQMPEGYNTVMYEGGDNLSGGQKRRLNLARAIVRDTPILILDEPVTGLDARAEANINAALHRLTRGRTTFIIAHKFSTIASADKVLLLEAGQLAHQGTHEQLLRASAQYRKLYALHLGRQQEVTVVEAAAEGSNGYMHPAAALKSGQGIG